MKVSNWILILALSVIAVLLFGWAGYDYLQERAFLARAETVPGTITALELTFIIGSTRGRVCPRIKFTTKVGEPVTFLADYNICEARGLILDVGQHVTVLLSPVR